MLAHRRYHADKMTVDSIKGHGEATTTINGSNVGAGSTPGDGSSSIARSEADKAALRRERELGAGNSQ